MVREIKENELDMLLELYVQLGEHNPIPSDKVNLKLVWEKIISNPNYHIIVYEKDGKLISSCTVLIVPNLTHEVRPYAFVENVVTDNNYRKQGLGTACLDFAKEIAKKENCYKMMLMTGSKKESTLNFYKKAGYYMNDKTAFIMWI